MGKLLNKLKKAYAKGAKKFDKIWDNTIGELLDKIFPQKDLTANDNDTSWKDTITDTTIDITEENADYMTPEQRAKSDAAIEEWKANQDKTVTERFGMPSPNIYDNLNQEGIIDTTDQNIESAVNGGFTMDDYKTLRNEQWAREDQIRRETQAREDSAYQRATEDMRKAGINPNLVGINPAASGGGITNATGIDTSLEEMDLEKSLKELENYLDRELKADEGQKDRLTDIITTVLMFFAFKK